MLEEEAGRYVVLVLWCLRMENNLLKAYLLEEEAGCYVVLVLWCLRMENNLLKVYLLEEEKHISQYNEVWRKAEVGRRSELP